MRVGVYGTVCFFLGTTKIAEYTNTQGRKKLRDNHLDKQPKFKMDNCNK